MRVYTGLGVRLNIDDYFFKLCAVSA